MNLAVILLAVAQIVDLMNPFFATNVPAQPIARRVTLFKERVLYPNPALYDNGYAALDDPHIAWYLQHEAKDAASVGEAHALLVRALPQVLSSFAAAFPKFNPATLTVYLMPSMGSFDGMTKDVDGHHGLLLGVDNIAEEKAPTGVLIDHELFHVYHHDVNPAFFPTKTENDLYQFGVYRQVWAEGMATFVSQQLNAGTTEATALFSQRLASLPVQDRKLLACFVEQHFDSRSGADATLLFDGGKHPPGLPARGGYLIGYLVAKQLSAKMSLSQLADLQGDTLESALRAGVHALCETGAAS